MKGCPRCDSMDAWVLGDKRLKCRNCGRRYRRKSVWESVRLSDTVKEALLESFVQGAPAAKITDEHACIDSRERFYRLARACCAKIEPPARDGLYVSECLPTTVRTRPAMRGWSTSQRVIVIGFAERDGQVQVSALPKTIANVLPRMRERIALGAILQLDDKLASACLQIQSDYVIVPKITRAALGMSSAEAFWRFVRLHLQTFRKVPLKFFHLYLAEACLRFNQREQDLHALLREAMRTIAIDDVRPLLSGDPVRIGPGQPGFSPAQCIASHIAAS